MKKSLLLFFILTLAIVNNPLFAQHKLTIHFKDMGVHVGQTLGIQIVDKMTNQLVAFHNVEEISTEFSTKLYALLVDHSYVVQFYADHNGNGMYDDPPADHTYQLELDNVQGDTVLDFTHNTNFATLDWKPDYDYHLYQGEWTGRWHNLTYDTTDSLTFTLTIDEENKTIAGAITTQGAFGNPDQVAFNFESEFDSQADTLKMAMPEPWQGEIIMTGGSIYGMVTDPTLFGVGISLEIHGNFAISQFIATYKMSGAFAANGVMWADREFSLPAHVIEDNAQIPKQFDLSNYPNPFNPTTTIQYSLGESSDVSIRIFNSKGEQVAQLVNSTLSTGQHQITWNAHDMPSGVYFITMQAGTEKATKRILLMK